MADSSPTPIPTASEGEDAFIARHRTGFIDSSAYRRLEEPSGSGGYIANYPIVLGSLTLSSHIDGLAGYHECGKPYAELFAEIQQVRAKVSKITPEIGKGYPEWFSNVYFTVAGKDYMLRNKSKAELEDPAYLRLLMVMAVLPTE